MLSASVQIVLILVLGGIVMMLIAAISKRGLEVGRSKIIFLPPDTACETEREALRVDQKKQQPDRAEP